MAFTQYIRNNFLLGMGNARARNAVKAAFPNVTTAYVTTAQSANGTTVLAAVTELSLDLIAGTHYWIRGYLPLSLAAAANNIKFDLNGGTATATAVAGTFHFAITAAATDLHVDVAALNTGVSGSTSTAWTSCSFDVHLLCSVGGKLQLQFAQVASAANNSTISAGAFMVATPLDPIISG